MAESLRAVLQRGAAAAGEELSTTVESAMVAAIEAFRERVNASAEADMLGGNSITGAHHRALEAEWAELRREYGL